MKSVLLLVVLLAVSRQATSSVQINEIQVFNRGSFKDELGDSPPWLELWNPTGKPVSLSGWYLVSLDIRNVLTSWRFPNSSTVNANSFLVVYCDGKNIEGSLHSLVSFSNLGPGGYGLLLGLFNSSLSQVSGIDFRNQTQLPGISFGFSASNPLLV